ncbi:deoxyribose-phosphate aldolase [soil metagenome]
MSSESHRIAALALHCLDLTSLRDDDTDARIIELADAANTSHGSPAALCVYPRFIATARKRLDELGLRRVAIAAVTNFPHGNADSEAAVRETQAAVAAGADEIDVVLPYRALQAGDSTAASTLVANCRAACDAGTKPVRLKVILETGVLLDAPLIRKACEIALDAGADFLKTSTGKVPVNATPEAATILLETIRAHGSHAGFKAAGGVATLADAAHYLTIAERIMGSGWPAPERFRFGASGLLTRLLAELESTPHTDAPVGGAY